MTSLSQSFWERSFLRYICFLHKWKSAMENCCPLPDHRPSPFFFTFIYHLYCTQLQCFPCKVISGLLFDSCDSFSWKCFPRGTPSRWMESHCHVSVSVQGALWAEGSWVLLQAEQPWAFSPFPHAFMPEYSWWICQALLWLDSEDDKGI